MADDLVAFLRARLDEDEQVARAAGGKKAGGHDWLDMNDQQTGLVGDNCGTVVTYRTGAGGQHTAHIARHDPARVLAEVEAKRQIVDRYAWLREHGDTGGTAWVLPLLALPYADHPDYRAEWRP